MTEGGKGKRGWRIVKRRGDNREGKTRLKNGRRRGGKRDGKKRLEDGQKEGWKEGREKRLEDGEGGADRGMGKRGWRMDKRRDRMRIEVGLN